MAIFVIKINQFHSLITPFSTNKQFHIDLFIGMVNFLGLPRV